MNANYSIILLSVLTQGRICGTIVIYVLWYFRQIKYLVPDDIVFKLFKVENDIRPISLQVRVPNHSAILLLIQVFTMASQVAQMVKNLPSIGRPLPTLGVYLLQYSCLGKSHRQGSRLPCSWDSPTQEFWGRLPGLPPGESSSPRDRTLSISCILLQCRQILYH